MKIIVYFCRVLKIHQIYKMDKNLNQYFTFLKPYKGILLFLFLLFFFHFSWKIAIDGDIVGDNMYLFGKDITPKWFYTACRWLTAAAAWFIRLFPNTQDLVEGDNLLYFPNGGFKISIIWGCTGIKQMFIFTGIMLFYKGPFLKKLWYIPLGCIILTIYNVIRVGVMVIFTNGHPERFDSLHDGILRYIYYGIVFLLWVIWEEFIVNKNNLWKEIRQIFKR
jgi:exosortase/archaeosortase family protein